MTEEDKKDGTPMTPNEYSLLTHRKVMQSGKRLSDPVAAQARLEELERLVKAEKEGEKR